MSENKVRRFQDRLYAAAKSDPERRFHSLRDKVYRKDILKLAWEKVKLNHGSPGPNGETIGDIMEAGVDEFLDGLQSELKDGTYHPGPLLRTEVEKRSGGIRPLGIPDIRDRVVQGAVKIVIEPIFEAGFMPFSYGYRPGKSQHDATKKIYTWLNFGLEHVLDGDIEHCFDEIPHDKLMKEVARRISDGYVLKLIKMWLKSPVLIDGTLHSVNKGTPQGGVISPLLANIYLHQLDAKWVDEGMTWRYGPNAQMVRFADDIVVLSDKSLDGPVKKLRRILADLGLKLSERKTKVVMAEEGFDFLGFRFVRRHSKKYGKRKSYYFPSPDSVKCVKEEIRKRTSKRVTFILPKDVAKNLNDYIQGWGNYFRHSNAGAVLSEVQGYLTWRFRRFLRRRKNKSGIERSRDISSRGLYERYGLVGLRGTYVCYR